MHRQIAGKLTGRVTKWFVLAFWIVAFVGPRRLRRQAHEVQNNEASSWLPGNAESTKALDKLEPFQDPNAIPTDVVYEKKSGLTPDDLATDEASRPPSCRRWTASRARSSARSRPRTARPPRPW